MDWCGRSTPKIDISKYSSNWVEHVGFRCRNRYIILSIILCIYTYRMIGIPGKIGNLIQTARWTLGIEWSWMTYSNQWIITSYPGQRLMSSTRETNEPECSHVKHFCETNYFNSLVTFTLYTLHLTLDTLQCTLFTPHSTLYFTVRTLHFTFYTPATLDNPHSPLYTLRFTLHTLHFTLYTLHSTLYTLDSTL